MSSQLETYTTRATAVGAEVHRFKGNAEALAFIQNFMKEEGVSNAPKCGAVWVPGSFLDAAGQAEMQFKVPGLTFKVTKDASADAIVGVTQVDWAVSSIGSVVMDGTKAELRMASALPKISIVVLDAQKIVDDIGTVLTCLKPSEINCINFITGPSRTADIERVLTIGVHGPDRLIVVAVDEFERVSA